MQTDMQQENTPAAANTCLSLKVVTPDGLACQADCDSIILPLADDQNGEGGGSIGIRKNHVSAAMALKSGSVRAMSAGSLLCALTIDGGFATVDKNIVTVITDSAQPDTPQTPAV